MRRRSIRTAFWRSMRGEVLRLGHYGVIRLETFSLRTANVGQAKLSSQIRIFTKILLDTPPSRLARQIQNRREDHVNTRGTNLGCDGCPSPLGKIGVPSSG